MSKSKEVRTIQSPVEIRTSDGGEQYIIGYAAKFNQLSEDMWGFREQIAPGAFDGIINDDVRALFNHDSNMVLGRTKAGTLEITIDELGLRYKVLPPDTTWAKDLIISMQRGDINQSSFAFVVEDDDWNYDKEKDLYTRTITKVKRLYDVSPVTYPAYEQTESVVAKRGFEDFKEKVKTEEFHSLHKRKLALELELLTRL